MYLHFAVLTISAECPIAPLPVVVVNLSENPGLEARVTVDERTIFGTVASL